MAIKGSLKEASLPDVLQLLALGQKSGCLSIADRSNFGAIYFERGRICYASIVNRRDRLGDILVKHGTIKQEQLEAAIEQQASERDKKLGQILVAQGVISQQDLERYMRVQIEESVYYLFTWTQGTFHFETDIAPEQQDFLVSINPESLLLEGARRVDEWSLIEKKISSFDLIFIVDRDRLAIAEGQLTESQTRILAVLDGRDVNQVVEDTGLSEFEVGKSLYGLITAGFVHRAGRTPSAVDVQVTDARVEEHRNLGVAFYKTAMYDEAAREFRRVAELRPSDAGAPFFLGLVALRHARWREAVDALRLAAEKAGGRPTVLHNLGLAYEQLGRLDDAEATWAEAAARARTDARIHLGWGIVALKRGDYGAAATRLDHAQELFGTEPLPPVWFWARTLTAASAADFELAETLGARGVSAYPTHAVLQNNLAVLQELAGELGAAEELVRAARQNEPSLPQLSKNAGDLAYRASRYDDAWDAYQRAIELAPDLGDDVYFKLGNIAYKRTDRDLAAQLWRRALALNPKHELVKANLDTLKAVS